MTFSVSYAVKSPSCLVSRLNVLVVDCKRPGIWTRVQRQCKLDILHKKHAILLPLRLHL